MKIINETNETICIKPGEEINLSFKGDYDVEKETVRVMATRSRILRITDKNETS